MALPGCNVQRCVMVYVGSVDWHTGLQQGSHKVRQVIGATHSSVQQRVTMGILGKGAAAGVATVMVMPRWFEATRLLLLPLAGCSCLWVPGILTPANCYANSTAQCCTQVARTPA